MDNNNNRPHSRQKNVTSGGSGVHRRGDGLGTGQVGNGSGGRPSNGGGGKRAITFGGGGLGLILILLFSLMGNGGLGGLLGSTPETGNNSSYNTGSQNSGNTPSGFNLGNSRRFLFCWWRKC